MVVHAGCTWARKASGSMCHLCSGEHHLEPPGSLASTGMPAKMSGQRHCTDAAMGCQPRGMWSCCCTRSQQPMNRPTCLSCVTRMKMSMDTRNRNSRKGAASSSVGHCRGGCGASATFVFLKIVAAKKAMTVTTGRLPARLLHKSAGATMLRPACGATAPPRWSSPYSSQSEELCKTHRQHNG